MNLELRKLALLVKGGVSELLALRRLAAVVQRLEGLAQGALIRDVGALSSLKAQLLKAPRASEWKW